MLEECIKKQEEAIEQKTLDFEKRETESDERLFEEKKVTYFFHCDICR